MTSFGSTFIGPDGYEYSSVAPGQDPRSALGNTTDSRSLVQQMLANMQRGAQQRQRVNTALDQTRAANAAVNMAGGFGGFGNPAKTAAIDARRRAMAVNTSNYNRYKKNKNALSDLQRMFGGGATDQEPSATEAAATAPVVVQDPETGEEVTVEAPVSGGERLLGFYGQGGRSTPEDRPAPEATTVSDSRTAPSNPMLGFFGLGERSAPEDKPAPPQTGGPMSAYETASAVQEARLREWQQGATLAELQQFRSDPNYQEQVLDSIGYQPNLAQRMLGGDVDTGPSAGERLLGVLPDALKQNPLDASVSFPSPVGDITTNPRTMYNDTREVMGLERTDVGVSGDLASANERYEQGLQDAITRGYTSNNPVDQLAALEAKIVLARRGQQDIQSRLNTSSVTSGGLLSPVQQFFGGVGEYFGGSPVISPDTQSTLRSTLGSFGEEIASLELQRDRLRGQFPGINTEGLTPAEYLDRQQMREAMQTPTTADIAASEAFAAEQARVRAADDELSAYRYMLDQFPPTPMVSSPNYLYTADPVYNPATGEIIRRGPIDRYGQAIDPFLAAPDIGAELSRNRVADNFFNAYADQAEAQVGGAFATAANAAGPYAPAAPPQGASHGMGQFGRPLRPSDRSALQYLPGALPSPAMGGGNIPMNYIPGYHTPGLPVGVPAVPPRVPMGYVQPNPLQGMFAYPYPTEVPVMRAPY